MKRQRTLAAFGFTKKVVHHGKEIEVNIPETTWLRSLYMLVLKHCYCYLVLFSLHYDYKVIMFVQIDNVYHKKNF